MKDITFQEELDLEQARREEINDLIKDLELLDLDNIIYMIKNRKYE